MLSLGDLSDAEVAEIIDAHQREMENAMRRQDRERDEEMNALRKKLAERRRKREAALKAKHAQEVRVYIKEKNILECLLIVSVTRDSAISLLRTEALCLQLLPLVRDCCLT